jgi:hypothetical protein
MKRIYVAGALSADACGYIQNCHRMIELARWVRRMGFAVYIPCLDFLEGLVAGDFQYNDYFDNSQPWLEASDGVVVQPIGAEASHGTQREIAHAEALGIPVFRSLEALASCAWDDEVDD